MGELGVFFKIIKTVILYVIFFSLILNQVHILFFGIANLFVDHYNFELQNRMLNPNYISREYNNFL
jgi:hypothetical protein